jgi:hypothetical protein
MIARLLTFAGAAAALWISAAGVNADPIGDVVSVVPEADYQRNGAVAQLSVNDFVEQNDRVITTGDGSAYIHFLDDTVLTVGVNSEVVLDKFVFDGDKAKTAVIQITHGTLRFVTGLSDHSAYQIKTPVATIGVRGTTIDVGYENDRMVYNTVDGLGIVCHFSAGCQQVRAGMAPIAVGRGGFSLATAAEAARMRSIIDRSHFTLSQRIGRNPGNMLAFARDRGRLQTLMSQKGLKGFGPKGLEPKGLEKGFGPKGFEQKGLGQQFQQRGQKPGLFQRLLPGKKGEKQKNQDQR